MEYKFGLIHALFKSVVLNDVEWLGKIFNDRKHRAVSLRQLNFLFWELCKKTGGDFFVNAGHSWVEVCNCLRRCDDIVPREAATVAGDVDTGSRQKTLCWVAIAASSLSTHGSRGSSGQLVSATAVPSRAASCDSAGADWSSGRWRYHDYDTAPTKRARRDLRRRLHCSATVAARPDDTGRSRYDPRPGCGKCRRRTPDCILPHRSRIPRRRR